MAWDSSHYKERLDRAFEANVLKELADWKIVVLDPGTKGASHAMLIHGKNQKTGAGIQLVTQQYSACCAFHQINYFSYFNPVTEKMVHAFFDCVKKTLRENYSGHWGKKLILNTVRSNPEGYHSNQTDLVGKTILGDVIYPFVHSWAKKAPHGCIDTPIVNQNTGNIIHHLICFMD